jgi:hypothetical protein
VPLADYRYVALTRFTILATTASLHAGVTTRLLILRDASLTCTPLLPHAHQVRQGTAGALRFRKR